MNASVASVPVVGKAEAGVSASLTRADLAYVLIGLGWLLVRYRELGPEYDDERSGARATMEKVRAIVNNGGVVTHAA